MTDADVADALLAWLRSDLGRPELAYAEPPRRLAWGFETTVYAFSLDEAPASHRGELVLRLFLPGVPTAQAGREAAVQDTVRRLGFPAPAPLGWGRLGGEPGRAFLVMERLPGRTFMEVTLWASGAAFVASLFGLPELWLLVGFLYVGAIVREMRRLHALPVQAVNLGLAEAGVEGEELGLQRALERMQKTVHDLGASGLQPGLDWLLEHVPETGNDVLCHGDFWPGNLLCDTHGIRGVIDWGDAALAPPELELAWSRIAFYSGLPIPGPAWIAEPVGEVTRPLAWAVLGLTRVGYRLVKPLDRARLHYFTAYQCLRALVTGATRRAAAHSPDAKPSPWALPRVVELLERRFLSLTGVSVTLAGSSAFTRAA